jgi:hypothetical protein
VEILRAKNINEEFQEFCIENLTREEEGGGGGGRSSRSWSPK